MWSSTVVPMIGNMFDWAFKAEMEDLRTSGCFKTREQLRMHARAYVQKELISLYKNMDAVFNRLRNTFKGTRIVMRVLSEDHGGVRKPGCARNSLNGGLGQIWTWSDSDWWLHEARLSILWQTVSISIMLESGCTWTTFWVTSSKCRCHPWRMASRYCNPLDWICRQINTNKAETFIFLFFSTLVCD